MREAKRDCKDVANRLNGFEDAWHLVRLGCDNLLQTISLANEVSVSRIRPSIRTYISELISFVRSLSLSHMMRTLIPPSRYIRPLFSACRPTPQARHHCDVKDDH